MRSIIRPTLAAAALIGSLLPAFAGASSVPTNYQPDPALKTASRSELESRIRKSCAIVQARLQNVSEVSVSSSCGCYASRALRSFDASEIQAYRDTGVFNESARVKALAAIDACKLQRPL